MTTSIAPFEDIASWEPSPVTIAARVACISSFYRFLIRMDIVSANPCDQLERPRVSLSPPRGLSAEEIKRLLAVIPETPTGLRDRALILTLTLTGRRRSEVMNLKAGDISRSERLFYKYRGKGGKQAKREKLLRHVETPLDGGSYGLGRSRPLTVVSVGDKFEAFDDEDPEFDPIELTPADLARWRLDLEALAKRFQQTNRLTGTPGTLDGRLLFVGGMARDRLALAFVLGLFHEHRTALTHLRALPSSLPSRYDRFVVACPTFTPTPFEQRGLESLDVFVVPLNEREFEARRFCSRHAIHITGRIVRRQANVVQVGSADVPVTERPFQLFMRLVAGLFETDDGFLPRGSMKHGGGLADEGYYTSEDGPGAQPAPQCLSACVGRSQTDPVRRGAGKQCSLAHASQVCQLGSGGSSPTS